MTDSENPVSKETHQEDQLELEAGPPHCGMKPQLVQGKNGKDQPQCLNYYETPALIVPADIISAHFKLLF